jgi:Cu(I)/Ag(I) efflux system membrane protein CusA/SilA
MIETIIMLKPKSEWRAGITKKDIVDELDAKLQIPGVVNGWTQPIINRINMLSTGIRTDVGVKVHGQNLDTIYAVSEHVKKLMENIPGVKDLYVEPITGGKYLLIDIDRNKIGRFGLGIQDVNMIVETAIGGTPLGNTVEGRKRFSINVRLPQDYRNSIDRIKRIPLKASVGTIPLSSVAAGTGSAVTFSETHRMVAPTREFSSTCMLVLSNRMWSLVPALRSPCTKTPVPAVPIKPCF